MILQISNSECSISQVKIKHELCNTTLSCLPFAAWSFGPLCVCHVRSCELCFVDFHEGITTSDILHETIHVLGVVNLRDPTQTKGTHGKAEISRLQNKTAHPLTNSRIFLRGENPGEF